MEIVNTRGRGALGTPSNSPTNDGGTSALVQNRPNAPQGAAGGIDPLDARKNLKADALSKSDYDFITSMIKLQASHTSIEKLERARADYVHRKADAVRQSGSDSYLARWNQAVIDCYDEKIAFLKTPIGRSSASLEDLIEKYKKNKKSYDRDDFETALNELDKIASEMDPDDPERVEAMGKIKDGFDCVIDHGAARLEDLADRLAKNPDSVPDPVLKFEMEQVLNDERQRQVSGFAERQPSDTKDDTLADPLTLRLNAVTLAIVQMQLNRDIKAFEELLKSEEARPGSVPTWKFSELWNAIVKRSNYESDEVTDRERLLRANEINALRERALLLEKKQRGSAN